MTTNEQLAEVTFPGLMAPTRDTQIAVDLAAAQRKFIRDLREHREMKGLTVTEVAALMKVDASQVDTRRWRYVPRCGLVTWTGQSSVTAPLTPSSRYDY